MPNKPIAIHKYLAMLQRLQIDAWQSLADRGLKKKKREDIALKAISEMKTVAEQCLTEHDPYAQRVYRPDHLSGWQLLASAREEEKGKHG